MSKKIVFLGGTCNGSSWRDELIKMFDKKVEYFNPVVKEWTEEAKKLEDHYKEICDISLYVITPQIKGFYSIAEAVYDSFTKKTFFVVLDIDKFEAFNQKSLNAISKLLENNGVETLYSLEDVSEKINKLFQ